MVLLELSRSSQLKNWTAHENPFMRWSKPGAVSLASYWTDWTSEVSPATIVFISHFVENNTIVYDKVNTLSDCQAQARTFYWDNGNQILYVHLIHTSDTTVDHFAVGVSQGFSDTGVVYVGDIYFAPSLISLPKTDQAVDIANYNQLNFSGGTVSLNNNDGDLDDIINSPIFGNQLTFSYAQNGKSNLTREELQIIGTYYVEDYNFSVQKLTIKAQDKRKEQNAQVITQYLDDGTPVPVLFGQVRSAKSLPVNPDDVGDITFRVAESLTALGTVQVFIDKVWVDKTPSSTDLSTGQFTLTAANGRVDGVSTNGPLDCRVILPIGTPIVYTSDIIIRLNESVLGVVFNSSNYDVTEWTSEQMALSSGGVLFDNEILLFDAIRIVQNYSSVGFRYEINASGQRTMRIDDWDRTTSFAIENSDIIDSNVLAVESNARLLAARAVVRYSKDYNYGKYLTLVDESVKQEVLDTYKQMPTLTVDTILTNLTDAQTRASWALNRFKTVPRIVSLKVFGNTGLRIFDTGEVDLGLENGRDYFGRWKASVISVNPDYTNLINTVKMILISEV